MKRTQGFISVSVARDQGGVDSGLVEDTVEAIEHGFNQDKSACTRLREACGGS